MATRAERIHAVIAHMMPEIAAEQKKSGRWIGGTAPYVIDEYQGKPRIRANAPDGTSYAGLGDTIDDALTALEVRCGLKAKEKADV